MATMMAGSTDTLGDVLTLNFRVHRLHLMYDYRQQSEELIDDFVNRARILADKCQFTDDELNERLIELLVYSTPYEGLRQELLTKPAGYSIEDALQEGRKYEVRPKEEPDIDVKIQGEDQDQNQDHLLSQELTPTNRLSTHNMTAESDVESDNADQLMDTVDWTSQENILISPSGFAGAESPAESLCRTNAMIQPSPESERTFPAQANMFNAPETSSGCVTQDRQLNVMKDVKPDVSNQKVKSDRKKAAKFQCTICERTFRSASLVSAHKKTHTSEKPDKSHKRSDGIPHSVKSYTCDLCGKSFNNPGNFAQHKNMHARKLNPVKKSYKCDGCGKSFTQNFSRSLHMSKCPKLAVIDPEKAKLYKEKIKIIKCDVCGKCFDRRDNFTQHKRIHSGTEESPIICNICGKIFRSESSLSLHMKIHTGEMPYKCEVCDKRFLRRRTMAIHMRLHTGENMTQCEICGKQFQRATYLKSHMRTHTGEKPYKCDECGQCFFDTNALRRHKVNHSETQIICEICGASFKSADYLPIHMRKHTGEKPFKCDVCDKCFAQSGHLAEHKTAHTGEKRHKCATCGRCFRLAFQLKQHMVIHTDEKPFSCEICNKSYKKACYLSTHVKTHTELRPYTCEICDNAFKTLCQKNNHMAVHTDERPYKCDICDKRFKRTQDRNAHRKTHSRLKSDQVESINASDYL